jgi:2-amino-4-hydroxy-6-hydroxymethyldihydropteridine diphosphokinase
VEVVAASHIYATAPLGPGRQAQYLNAVVEARAPVGPAALLRALKRIERRSGRRLGVLWGPRSLDIDILDFAGRRLGWPARRRQRGTLVLPHPEMHRRAFVLVPLLEAAPHWRHPVLRVAGRTLLARIPKENRRGVRQSLDFVQGACDKALQ